MFETSRAFISNICRYTCLSLFSITLCSMFAMEARADHAGLLSEYTHTAWTANDGAPSDIQAITQTKEGWLWISAPTGLYRFDGSSFLRMESIAGADLLSSIVLPIYAPPDGGLWVGYRFGGASFFKDGIAHHYAGKEGFPPGAAMSFARAPDGKIWATTNQGLAYLEKDHWVSIGAEAGFDPHPIAVRQVLFDHAGTQWVSTAAGVYYRHNAVGRFSLASPHNVELWSIAEGPDGVIWASDGKDGNYRLSLNSTMSAVKPQPDLPGSGMWFDRSGNMWLLRVSSVEKMLPTLVPDVSRRLTKDQGLSGNSPQTFFEDREGNIWIGTAKGLDRFHPNRLLPLQHSMTMNQAALAPDKDGSIWAGDWVKNTLQFDTSSRVTFRVPQRFMAAATGNDGFVRLGTPAGIWWRDGKKINLIAPPVDLVKDGADIRALAQDSDGVWWASFLHKGLYLYSGKKWTAAHDLYPSLPEEREMTILAEPQGRVWIGYLHNRLVLIYNGKFRVFDENEGLDIGNVLSLYDKRGHLWVAGERGVAWYDGARFIPLRAMSGNQFRGVTGLVETSTGDLWLHANEGVFHIAADDVRAFLQKFGGTVNFELFDSHDGLSGTTSPVGPFPSMVEGTNGWLWIATASNLVHIDPRTIKRNHLPPPVEIRGIYADGKQYGIEKKVQLPVGSSNVHISFSALALSIPSRVAFLYRLEGIDRSWQSSEGRHDAFYSNIGPGNYRFQVIAANEDNVWNQTGASVELVVPPAFTQTLEFKLLCLGLLIVLIYLGYRLRLRHLIHMIEIRMQARQQERERVARTIHDTLLQGIQGALLMIDVAVKKVPADSESRKPLENTICYLEETLEEGREQVMELQSSMRERGCFVDALRRVGSRMADSLPAKFHVKVTGAPYHLQEMVWYDLFAISREAMMNAFRHAGAQKVEVEVVYGNAQLEILVRDNGKGFDAGSAMVTCERGHLGLLSMQERAARIGAQLEVNSTAGEGTRIHVTLSDDLARDLATYSM